MHHAAQMHEKRNLVMSCRAHLPFLFLLILASGPIRAHSQSVGTPQTEPANDLLPQAHAPVGIIQPAPESERERRLRAQQQLEQQERQRILGVIPNFNTSLIQNAEPLSPSQKFHLVFKNAFDPFQFASSGIEAALGQRANNFAGYGQGAQGYAKRFAASYVDAFDASLFGGAVFPILLHQDSRYYRLGNGTFQKRLFYAIVSTVRVKGDNRKWQPNYSSFLGNLAAGGISNLYYPADNRGAALTFERAFSESFQGAIGNVFIEFWPDMSQKYVPHFLNRETPTPGTGTNPAHPK